MRARRIGGRRLAAGDAGVPLDGVGHRARSVETAPQATGGHRTRQHEESVVGSSVGGVDGVRVGVAVEREVDPGDVVHHLLAPRAHVRPVDRVLATVGVGRTHDGAAPRDDAHRVRALDLCEGEIGKSLDPAARQFVEDVVQRCVDRDERPEPLAQLGVTTGDETDRLASDESDVRAGDERRRSPLQGRARHVGVTAVDGSCGHVSSPPESRPPSVPPTTERPASPHDGRSARSGGVPQASVAAIRSR